MNHRGTSTTRGAGQSEAGTRSGTATPHTAPWRGKDQNVGGGDDDDLGDSGDDYDGISGSGDDDDIGNGGNDVQKNIICNNIDGSD